MVSSTNTRFITLDDMLHAKGIETVTEKMLYPVALGKDIFGNLDYEDLADMLHTAYTGSTVSGKSVGLQCLIMSLAKEYLAAHFEEIPLLRRRELIKRIIDKVVWNGERLEVFLVTSTSGGTEITDEVISAPEKSVAEPPRPEETDGYCEFRKCADLVVRAFAKSQNISLRQLAKHCGVSYTTVKYWTGKRNSPSRAQYEAVFKDYFLNVYNSSKE